MQILDLAFKILALIVVPVVIFLAKMHTRVTVLESSGKERGDTMDDVAKETAEHGLKIATIEEAMVTVKAFASEIRNDVRTMKDLAVATQTLVVSSEKRLQFVEEQVWNQISGKKA